MTVLPVVVLGAGPTGVLAAALLGQQGVDCLVLDRTTDVHPQPRAVHLDDEVRRLLARAGADEAFGPLTRPSLGLRLLDPDHRVLAEFARSAQDAAHGFPQASTFDQPDLERALRDLLDRYPQVALRGGVEVTAVRQPDDGPVHVELTDLATGRTEEVLATWVLGCDGAGSLTRRCTGTALRDLGFAQRWFVVDVSTDADLGAWDGVHQVCDTQRAATFLRVGPTRYRWEFRLRDGESADDLAVPERLLPLLAPWTGALPAERLHVVRTAEYVFRAQVAERWRDRRVLLLGDAAHLTPPFIGQGLGAGLRDAANLSWKLAGVVRGELDEQVLDSYQAERLPHVLTLIRLAVLLGRAMTAGGRGGDLLRRVVVPRLHLVPGLRTRVLDSETAPLSRSALVHGHGPLVGRLVPNALLTSGRRVDDLAPARFLVVAAGPVAAADGAEVARRGAVLHRADRGDALHRWLRTGRAGAVVVRPDGTVLVAGRDVPAVLPHLPAFHPPRSAPRPLPVAGSRLDENTCWRRR